MILLLFFLIGFIIGHFIGVYDGQMLLFQGVGTILGGSNNTLNIDLNETQMVDRTYEKMEPFLEKWLDTINKTK